MIDIEHHIVILFDSQIVIWLHNCAKHNICQETCYYRVLNYIRIFFFLDIHYKKKKNLNTTLINPQLCVW